MKTLILTLLMSFNIFAADVKDFSLPAYVDGKEFKLSEHLGKRTIILNFWASWCTSCIQELPELHALKEKYPKAMFIGINSGERKKLVKKFLRRYKFNYDILVDKKKKVAALYGIESLPRTIVISKDKKISFSGNRPPKSFSE